MSASDHYRRASRSRGDPDWPKARQGAAAARPEVGPPPEGGAKRDLSLRGAEQGEAPLAEVGPGPVTRQSQRVRRTFTREFKAALVEAWLASGEPAARFAAKHGLKGAHLIRWRDGRGRRAKLCRGRPPGQSPPAVVRRDFSPEEKRAAVEGLEKTGLTRAVFAKLFGTTARTLQNWVARYRSGGPKALEPRPRGRKKGSKAKVTPPAITAAIVTTKRRFPWFGIRKIRDLLRREDGLGVSARTVKKVVLAELADLMIPPLKPKRTKPRVIRRFERARPNELWQSDITSFVLARHRQPVYLTVFLDDHSRFIVSWALAMHHKADLVIEALRSGIAKYGKPKEVLTDQGRQYYAWRGKAAFQTLLQRDGIAHVVSRAHHPETLGKTERLWETIDREFWQRCTPEDLDDARARLGFFFAHYNFQRPHQSLGGLVPADRFFEASAASREAIEAQVAKNALLLALGQTPRKPVFLYGQIGSKRVSLHGERGRIVVHTGDGRPETLGLDELGGGGQGAAAPPPPVIDDPEAGMSGETSEEEANDGPDDDECDDEPEQRNEAGTEAAEHGGERGAGGGTAGLWTRGDPGRPAEADAAGQEAAPLHEAPAPGVPGAGLVGRGQRGGEAGVAPAVRRDPRVVAREGDPARGGGEARSSEPSAVAGEPAGPGGDAGRAPEAAAGPRPGDAAGV